MLQLARPLPLSQIQPLGQLAACLLGRCRRLTLRCLALPSPCLLPPLQPLRRILLLLPQAPLPRTALQRVPLLLIRNRLLGGSCCLLGQLPRLSCRCQLRLQLLHPACHSSLCLLCHRRCLPALALCSAQLLCQLSSSSLRLDALLVQPLQGACLLPQPPLLLDHQRLQRRRLLPRRLRLRLAASQRALRLPHPARQHGMLLGVAVGSAVQPILRLL